MQLRGNGAGERVADSSVVLMCGSGHERLPQPHEYDTSLQA